jgi:hypothetical protein
MITKNRAARTLAFTALASLTLVAKAAHADDYFSPTNEHVRISLGAMYVSSATALRADSSAGLIRFRTQVSSHGSGRNPATLELRLFHLGPVRQ